MVGGSLTIKAPFYDPTLIEVALLDVSLSFCFFVVFWRLMESLTSWPDERTHVWNYIRAPALRA